MRKKLKVLGVIVGSSIIGSCFFYFSAAAGIAHPVISQVQVGGVKASDEFIELFNPSTTSFNLNGFRLVTRFATSTVNASILKSWEDDAFIPPHSFFLWANASYGLANPMPDATTTVNITSSYRGIGLERKTDTVIVDGIAWGSETDNGLRVVWNSAPPPNQSLSRQDLFFDSPLYAVIDSNPRSSMSAQVLPPQENDPTPTPTVIPTLEPTPTPESTPTPSPSPAAETPAPTSTWCSMVKISEILADPTGADAGNETVELVSSSTQDILLDGWFLLDGGSTSHPVDLSGKTLATSSYLTITIPATGHFTLSNSGDTVNVYCGDQMLADTQSYGSGSQEGWSWQNVNGQWMWAPATLGAQNAGPPPAQSTGGGGGSSYSPVTVVSPTASSSSTSSLASIIQITEFLPNPEGDDPGKEWVEIYNASSSDVSLQGFILDDSSPSSTPQSGSWAIEGGTVPAKGFLVLAVPEEKFSLNNTGQDSVRLFDKSKKLIEEVFYKDAPEGLSFSRTQDGKWIWGPPSRGAENIAQLPDYRVIITEILPNPEDEEEFLEIKNVGSVDVPVKGLTVSVGARKNMLDIPQTLKPGQVLAVYGDDLGLLLSNAGQTIRLADHYGRVLSTVVYPKAPKGESFNFVGESYEWSGQPTPGEENVLVLGESTGTEDSASAKTKAAGKTSTASTKKLEEQNKELAAKLESLQLSVSLLSEQLENLQSAPAVPVANAQAAEDEQPAKPKTNRYWYLGVSMLSLVLLVGAMAWYIKKENTP